jgi:hypothetical protein
MKNIFFQKLSKTSNFFPIEGNNQFCILSGHTVHNSNKKSKHAYNKNRVERHIETS